MSRPPLGCSVCIGADEPLPRYWTKDQKNARWYIERRSNLSGTKYWFGESYQYAPPIGLEANDEAVLHSKIKAHAAANQTLSEPVANPYGNFEKFNPPYKAVAGMTVVEGPPSPPSAASSSWLPIGIGVVAIALVVGTLKAK